MGAGVVARPVGVVVVVTDDDDYTLRDDDDDAALAATEAEMNWTVSGAIAANREETRPTLLRNRSSFF